MLRSAAMSLHGGLAACAPQQQPLAAWSRSPWLPCRPAQQQRQQGRQLTVLAVRKEQTGLGRLEAAVPREQRPVNELQQLKDNVLCSWATLPLPQYGQRLLALYAGVLALLGGPIAAQTFEPLEQPLEFFLSASTGSLLVVAVAALRIYLAWKYVGDRLLTASLEYEETGWYDGQVFVKPPEVLARDRLLGTYEVRPVLARLRTTLQVVGVGLAGTAVSLALLINSQLDADGAYGRGSARKLMTPSQVTPTGIIYSSEVRDLGDLISDDEAAEREAEAQGGVPGYCGDRYFKAFAGGERVCDRILDKKRRAVQIAAAAASDAVPPQQPGGGGAGGGGKATPESLSRARQVGKAMDSEIAEKMTDLQRRLTLAERRLQEERERSAALAPYRVAAPKRGIVGNSRYAQQLRKQIVLASRDPTRRPVLVFGERGLEKDNIAALIHFGSKYHDAPFVRFDCDRLDDDASDLFGAGQKKGLLYYMPPEGTLLLNNIHKAPKTVLPLLRQTVDAVSRASMEDWGECEDCPSRATCDKGFRQCDMSGVLPRIIITAEEAQDELKDLCYIIKVPPLRVRPSDIRAMQAFFLRGIAREKNMDDISLTDEAVRQLEAYSYPLNIAELKTMVERAAAQSDNSGRKLSEDVFWFAKQPRDVLRYDLLKIPMVRQFLRSKLWPEDINFGFTVYAFAFLVGLLFLGPQDRPHNFGLNLFWCFWWPASFFIYPFLGRVWCAVCPFMIYGELVQRWRMSQGAQLLKWPREQMDKWGPWFLFSLFFGILVWEEVWDLPNTAALSSWLLLIITAGAMIGSWFFERRIWCRYLCPIGGMNGLFAKLSVTELRARQGVCSSTCKTYHCFKGGPEEPPEGLETMGCPVYSHPAQLVDNRNCVLCMECLKACPHRSIEFRLRLPGVDLWTTHKPLAAEVCLMFMLLGAVYLHDCDDVLLQLGLNPELFLDSKLPHILLSSLFLVVPGAIAWGVDRLWRLYRAEEKDVTSFLPAWAWQGASLAGAGAGGSSGSGSSGAAGKAGKAAGKDQRPREQTAAEARALAVLRASGQAEGEQNGDAAAAALGQQAQAGTLKPFVELAYGYLPLVYTATLAYYLDNAFEEAGLILPVAAATFGFDAPWLPTFTVAEVVTEFLQGSTLLFGAVTSLVLTRKLGARPWKDLWPQCLLIGLFTAELWSLILPN